MSIHFTRRDFMRATTGGAVAVGSSLFGLDTLAAVVAQTKRAPRSATVTVVRDAQALTASHDVNRPALQRMLGDTIVRVTGKPTPKAAWQSMFTPRDVVGIVPTPHLNPTHRELYDAVSEALVDAGVPAANIVNANGGIEKARACTALVCLPALKAHWLTGIGTVLKNYILFSGSPRNYHDQQNVRLGEVWQLPDVKGKTRLVLVDALRPLCDKGPQVDPRYLWDYNGLIAGTDPVAVESVALRIILAKRQQLRGEPWPLSPPPLCVAAADERYGLGTSRTEEIKLNTAGWAEGLLLA
ncbi:MAG: DUF362 domain-containing protein [Bacteroidales bacterium]